MQVSTNDIEQNLIRVGIDMVAFRTGMRGAHDDMIAAGAGTTAGIHDFGVFYVQDLDERFVMRDGDVYHLPQRTVLKLRPGRSSPTKLDESNLVRLTWAFSPPSSSLYVFDSTSRSGRFVTTASGVDSGQDFALVRDVYKNQQSLVMARSDISDADLQNTTSQRWSTSPDELLALRIDFQLQTMADGAGIGLDKKTDAMSFTARIDSGGIQVADRGSTDGREAIAWVRQRSIDISERP